MSTFTSRVIVNGEAVVFEGPPPATVQEAVALVDGALGQQGHIIEACMADGKALSDDPKILQQGYEILDVSSRPWQEVCADAVHRACLEVRGAMMETSSFGASMLVVPIGQVVKEIDQLAEKLRVIVKPLEIATDYAQAFDAPWRGEVDALSGRIQRACEDFSSALERHDIGSAADVLCILLPRYLTEFTHLQKTPWSGVEL